MSRYYDPETGRFISPDAIEYLDPSTIGGLNLYSYCNNNPVMGYDPSGTFDWNIFWNVLIGVGTILVTTALMVATAGIAATLLGASSAMISGAMTGALAGGLISGGINLGNQIFENGGYNLNFNDIVTSTIFGSAMGAFSGGIGILSSAKAVGTKFLIHRGMQAGANAIISFTGYILQSSINGEKITLKNAAVAIIGGFVSGMFFNNFLRALLTNVVFETIFYL